MILKVDSTMRSLSVSGAMYECDSCSRLGAVQFKSLIPFLKMYHNYNLLLQLNEVDFEWLDMI